MVHLLHGDLGSDPPFHRYSKKHLLSMLCGVLSALERVAWICHALLKAWQRRVSFGSCMDKAADRATYAGHGRSWEPRLAAAP